MSTTRKFNVIYTAYGSRFQQQAEVTVSETTDQFGPCFYAHNLRVFGCGKNDADPIGAVHRLVQDHGQVIAIQPKE